MQAQQLWISCLKPGDGDDTGITTDDLERALVSLERRNRAAVLRERERAAAGHGGPEAQQLEQATADLQYVAGLWDSVKDTAEQARFELYLENWSLMVKLQAQFRGLLARIRMRRGE